MRLQQRHRRFLVTFALVTAAAGCGSSSDNLSDSAVSPDTRTVFEDMRIMAPDVTAANDTLVARDVAPGRLDVATGNDAVADTIAVGVDGPAQGMDGGKTAYDALASEAGGGTIDTSPSKLDAGTGAPDAGGHSDGPADAAGGGPDAADAGFVPGPATPVVVNSGSTAQYSQGDGTWKVFYFDAVAGQVYAISELNGIVRGYVSTSPVVSPSNYQYATNTNGTLSFTATAAQRYYIAVAVSGGGASGSFQVADGGTPVALGTTVLALTAPDGDNYYFYRFPISAGHSYTMTATGPSQPSIGLAVSPRAERMSNGQFSYSAWGVGGSLPYTNQAIPAASVATSYSGYYYFFVRVTDAITVTVTITQSP